MESYTSRRSNRGQLSSLDLIVATMIFIGIILLFIWVWGEVQGTVWNFERSQGMKDKALDVADVLLHTEGYPTAWETLPNVTDGRVSSVGLVSESMVLDEDKLERFGDIPYLESRKLLGLEKEGFHLAILDKAGYPIYEFGEELGAGPVVGRLALLNGRIVDFELRLYEP